MLDANAATISLPVALVKISSNASMTSRSELREAVDVEVFAVDWRLIDLEIAGVDDDADRRADRERDAVGHAVRDADEFDLERPDRHPLARLHRDGRHAVDPVFL